MVMTKHRKFFAPERGKDADKESAASNTTQNGHAREVKQHLRCPCCWDGLGGRASRRKWSQQVNGPLQKRCYACNQCGTEWVVEVRSEVEDDIEYIQIRVTEVRERAAEQ